MSTYKPIAINRSAGHSAVNQVVKQGKERLAAGMGVVVYPEGTRVAPGQTRKYGVSGALLASRPARRSCRSRTTPATSGRGAACLKRTGTIYVVIGKPIDPPRLDPREVNEQAQQWIEATIAEIVTRPGGKPA